MMKQTLLFFYFLFFLASLQAAPANQTSPEVLIAKLKTAKEHARFEINLELARYYSEASSAEALKYANAAVDLGRKLILDDEEIAEMNSTMGAVYFYREDYEKSAVYYQNELKYHIENDELNAVMESSFNLALIYSYAKNYKKAAEYYEKSLAAALSLNNKSLQERIFIGLADSYYQLKKYENAYQSFKKYTEELNLSQKLSVLNARYKQVQTEKIATEKKVQTLVVDTANKSEAIKGLAQQNEAKSEKISLQDQTIQL